MLVFPDTERSSVLYWLTVGPSYRDAAKSGRLILSNEARAEPLRIQYVTNTISLKKTPIAGKIIGGLVGTLIFGASSGLAMSDFRNQNNGIYLGIGTIIGAAAFCVGWLFDLGDEWGKVRLFSK